MIIQLSNSSITEFNSIEHFTTPRLRANRIQPSDLDKLAIMDSNELVMATLGGVKTLEETKERLAWNLKQWDDYGHGLWLFYLKETNEWVGRASIRHMIVDNQPEIELGYAVMPNFWCQGYATEMAKACIEIAFKILHYENVACFTMKGNTVSERLMQKLGFQFEKECMHANILHVFYRMTHEYFQKITYN